ncbi:SecE domain-containing protein [Cephalotus follicularis]|uniref:SecE domain-containing protein n=1 Tax=Cephalotus follicularis TaxID=3775 RepID=A0A1Q3CAW9_CEPFO|nr:SecE domain-containing protein [Cephalotus follicularis]
MVMAVYGLQLKYSGVVHPSHAKLPCRIQRHDGVKFSGFCVLQISRLKFQYCHGKHSGIEHIFSIGSNRHHLSMDNGLTEEPFWLNPIKEAIWSLKSVFAFLVEQPSQLKYIEWPSFQNTLKTATLTLVLVALLIVALSSVDSVLCYLLAVLCKRAP